jgi:hypothetical protein
MHQQFTEATSALALRYVTDLQRTQQGNKASAKVPPTSNLDSHLDFRLDIYSDLNSEFNFNDNENSYYNSGSETKLNSNPNSNQDSNSNSILDSDVNSVTSTESILESYYNHNLNSLSTRRDKEYNFYNNLIESFEKDNFTMANQGESTKKIIRSEERKWLK